MSVYDYKVKNVKGESVDLSQYKGKVLIIANTASKCGFTPQYEGLEKLYKEYKLVQYDMTAGNNYLKNMHFTEGGV